MTEPTSDEMLQGLLSDLCDLPHDDSCDCSECAAYAEMELLISESE